MNSAFEPSNSAAAADGNRIALVVSATLSRAVAAAERQTLDRRAMERETLALVLSILSLCVASSALGWNVYREIALRAQVRTTLAVAEQHSPRGMVKKLYITAANHGPGSVQLQGFTVEIPKGAPFNAKHHLLPIDRADPMTTPLPKMLAVGETAQFMVTYGPELFFAAGGKRVGLTDSFGRVHWTPRRDGQHALKQFQEDVRDGFFERSV